MSLTPEFIIRRPILLTEKVARQKNQSQVVFEVAPTANKVQIKHAIETLFSGVKVDSVNTLVMRGKFRRMGRGHAQMQNWKKAIITLKEGEIDFFGTPATDSAES
jgi:large subunit ribosomal protein L23